METNTMNPQAIKFDENRKTLLLEVDKRSLDLSKIENFALGKGFEKKEEFHITAFGFKDRGYAVNGIMTRMPQDKKITTLENIKQLIEKLDWSFTLRPEFYWIAKDYTIPDHKNNNIIREHKESIIQMIDLPAMQSFYRELNSLLGTDFSPPPPHITLYTSGTNPETSKTGIGINSETEFRDLNPRLIAF